jgi:colicin import membrane protein
MRPRKYPLEPARRVRESRADDAKKDLASAIDARERAEQRRRAAEAEREQARGQARAVREKELAALARGELSAADLMRGDAWEARVREEEARRAREVAQAATKEAEAQGTEDKARGDLATRRADVEVVEKDRERWTAREKQAEEKREEEGAAEAWRPKRP